MEFLFEADSETVPLSCRFGFWGCIVTGAVRFDDVSLVPLVGGR